MFHILAISGSLRRDSSNASLLKAAAMVAPKGIEVVLSNDIARLPHFNPDLEDSLPQAVVDFRFSIAGSDGILFSTPEYAHSIPGSLKNALDWLVSGSEFIDKPVGLFHASNRSTYARASLIEILRTMSGKFLEGAERTLALLGKDLTAEAIASDPEMRSVLVSGLTEFMRLATVAP
ncbi:MAG: NAD(P)H-dependent oxidoreductase [Acidobacteriota bacterium]|nr:NAD(P)H-dependent oxidoreductase [Acidobacteriota bacterium]